MTASKEILDPHRMVAINYANHDQAVLIPVEPTFISDLPSLHKKHSKTY